MHCLNFIIGEPVCSVGAAAGGCVAVLTDKGFAVCDPLVFDTGSMLSDENDPSERCEFRRGQIHIRTGPRMRADPGMRWNLDPAPDWIVILPFESLPPESRGIISGALPEGCRLPSASVALLRRVMEAYRADERRLLRLRDALADAGYASPVTLEPAGLHSAPLRIHGRSRLRPLPLPKDHRLDAILLNWSGGREVVEFRSWRDAPAGDDLQGVLKSGSVF